MTLETANHEYRVPVDESRLDQFLAGRDTGLTRSRLQRLIVEGQVLVNGATAKPSNKVKAGDLVSLSVPPPRPSNLVPQDIPVTVVYQDENLVVIDKPSGLAVHPGPGHPDQTLVNALLAMCPDIQGIGGEIRPGIVHRLDKDTSGLMMVAKTHQARVGDNPVVARRHPIVGRPGGDAFSSDRVFGPRKDDHQVVRVDRG